MSLTIGDMLNNRYRIVKLLAQGGFGTLYRAWDTALGRPCVLKENLADTPDGQRQFLHEAKILANLSHPNLPRVTDYFLAEAGKPYLVMDYVEGQDLQQILEDQGKPFPEDRVLGWAAQLCDAIEYLHFQNPPIIHRDIKPANIQLTPSGKVVLVDFGIAKVYDPKQKTTLGAQAISPGYSPYEQYGKGRTDACSDIYSLGATLYTLLTGQEPPESIQRVVKDPLILPRQANPNLSMRTSAAIVRAMQLDPTQRFQKASDFKAALTPPPPIKMPPPAPASYQTPIQLPAVPNRSSPPWGWIALVSILVVIIIVLLMNNRSQEPKLIPAAQTSTELNPRFAASPTSKMNLRQTATAGSPPAPTVTIMPTLTPLVHTVQTGETCSEIAESFGVSIGEILAENTNLDPDCSLLYAGQPLLIPQLEGPVNTPVNVKSTAYSTLVVTQISEVDQMAEVFIPAGEFKMGAGDSDTDAADTEKPRHTIYLNAYWIDRTEVTNKMYEKCIEQSSCQPPGNLSSKTRLEYFSAPEFEDFPVIYVNWDDANRYCQWSRRRLPSEAEWEKAARGAYGLIYPWGNSPPSMRLANFGNLFGDALTVGSFPGGASPYGIWDLAGNVAEWVADWYSADYYAESLYKNPSGPADGEFKVIRGGSWYNQAGSLRTSFRLWNYPALQSDTIGFRCAK